MQCDQILIFAPFKQNFFQQQGSYVEWDPCNIWEGFRTGCYLDVDPLKFVPGVSWGRLTFTMRSWRKLRAKYANVLGYPNRLEILSRMRIAWTWSIFQLRFHNFIKITLMICFLLFQIAKTKHLNSFD